MTTSAVYSNFGGMVLAETRGGVGRIYVPDTLGSVVEMTDDSGTTTDTFEYWSYGEEKSRTGSSAAPFTWLGVLGYMKDVLNKLSYVRARYMRPELARWQTVDPLWPDESAYGYVRGEPITGVDPQGMEPVTLTTVMCQRAVPQDAPIIIWPRPCKQGDADDCQSSCKQKGMEGGVLSTINGWCACTCTVVDRSKACSPAQVEVCRRSCKAFGLPYKSCRIPPNESFNVKHCTCGNKK